MYSLFLHLINNLDTFSGIHVSSLPFLLRSRPYRHTSIFSFCSFPGNTSGQGRIPGRVENRSSPALPPQPCMHFFRARLSDVPHCKACALVQAADVSTLLRPIFAKSSTEKSAPFRRPEQSRPQIPCLSPASCTFLRCKDFWFKSTPEYCRFTPKGLIGIYGYDLFRLNHGAVIYGSLK